MKRLIILVMLAVLPALLFVNLKAQTSFVNYTTTDGLVDDFVCGGVCVDQANIKWFGTASGVSKYDGTSWTTYTVTEGMVDNYVTCIAYDNTNDIIWIGTNNGVSEYDGISFVNYTSVEGLIDNSVMNIAVDADGRAWITTFSGMSMINEGSITNFTTADGMSSDLTTSVHIHGTDVYIGTLNAGFMVYDGSTFEVYSTTDGLLDNYVSALFVDAADNVYVGSYAGLTVLDNSFAVTNTYTWDLELFNNYVQDILIDNDGNLVILEYADYLADGGITVFDGDSWSLYTTEEGLVDVMVKKAALDNEGNVWITTGSSVSKMTLGSGVANNYINAESNVYPNPASDYISIANIDGEFSYQITDITGRIVSAGENVANNRIDLAHLNSSVYFLTFESDNIIYSAKIIVK